MPGSDTDSEFDDIPDPFADIDWNTVPGLSDTNHNAGGPSTQAVVAAPPDRCPTPVTAAAPQNRGPTSSSEYSFDELDDGVLAELDRIEYNAPRKPTAGARSITRYYAQC